jgi:hypothetical protein
VNNNEQIEIVQSNTVEEIIESAMKEYSEKTYEIIPTNYVSITNVNKSKEFLRIQKLNEEYEMEMENMKQKYEHMMKEYEQKLEYIFKSIKQMKRIIRNQNIKKQTYKQFLLTLLAVK